MKLAEYTAEGVVVRDATTQELKSFAQQGNIQAIRELIAMAGGFSALTAAQKDKVLQLILGFPVTL